MTDDAIKKALERQMREQVEQGQNPSQPSEAAADAPQTLATDAKAGDVDNVQSNSAPQDLGLRGTSIEWRDDDGVKRTQTARLALPKGQGRGLLVTDQSSNLSTHFDLLRTKVLQVMAEKGWRTLGVLSATHGEGKTTTAANLALSIAKLPNQTALLLDLDLRRPGILTTLGLEPNWGLDDWLAGACEFGNTLFSPAIDHLVVTGPKSPISRSAEALASNRMIRQLAELRDRYPDRFIIVDMPAVLASDDALTLMPKIDCFLMVVAAGQSTNQQVLECRKMVPRDRFLGSVLNKSSH